MRKPNIVFVFSDQHRAQATGYAGNPDLHTPNMDLLHQESISFRNAVSGCPVCSPYRASLLTGQYPLTHGVFVNDVCLNPDSISIANVLKDNGYNTAYIGKWHIDGHGRTNYIPAERRQGFDFWQVLECTHSYNDSIYYDDEPQPKKWNGYDAYAQTRSAQNYIRKYDSDKPFVLFLSWGPPHAPYQTAPQEFRNLYDPEKLTLRSNVPLNSNDILKNPGFPRVDTDDVRKDLAGYYGHISAIDYQLGKLMETLKEEGIEDNTIFVYTSDHGDMLGSHGVYKKQRPYDESILVPFLLRYPEVLGRTSKEYQLPINSPDIMPTLLGLCDVSIPDTVEGTNYAPFLRGEKKLKQKAALIECIQPFGQWYKGCGGKEYRGLRTARYTYVCDLDGPWLLYNNDEDPYQLKNLCNDRDYRQIQKQLDNMLKKILNEQNDKFLSGEKYIDKWAYETDETGTVPY